MLHSVGDNWPENEEATLQGTKKKSEIIINLGKHRFGLPDKTHHPSTLYKKMILHPVFTVPDWRTNIQIICLSA